MVELTQIGHWAFLIGIALAVVAAFIQIPALLAILFILGLVVGFLNVKEKESSAFLIAVIALLGVGVAGIQLKPLSPAVDVIIDNFIAFVSASGLVVAIKQILTIER